MAREAENKKPYISVIIPMFNAENYVSQCVGHLQNSTYRNMEILLIDDGSEDATGAICDVAAAKDSRMIAVHKPNGGVSSARNLGMDLAKGEYLLFVDVDDVIGEKCLEKIHRHGEKSPDIIFFSFTRSKNVEKQNETGTGVVIEFHEQNKQIWIKNFMRPSEKIFQHANFPFVWGKGFRTQFIKENHLRFSEQLTINEDVLFMLQAFQCAETAVFEDSVQYCYLDQADSAVKRFRPEYSSQRLQIAEYKEAVLQPYKEREVIKKTYWFNRLSEWNGCFVYDFAHRDNPEGILKKANRIKSLYSESRFGQETFLHLDDEIKGWMTARERFLLYLLSKKAFLLCAAVCRGYIQIKRWKRRAGK